MSTASGEIQAQLQRDMRGVFYLSQGDQKVDRPAYYELAAYHHEFTDGEVLTEWLQLHPGHVFEITLPKKHEPKDPDLISETVQTASRQYINLLLQKARLTLGQMVPAFVEQFTTQDLMYNTVSKDGWRPERYFLSPGSSLVRTHLILGHVGLLQHSPGLQHLLARSRAQFPAQLRSNENLRAKVLQLQATWEIQHPDDTFDPDNFAGLR